MAEQHALQAIASLPRLIGEILKFILEIRNKKIDMLQTQLNKAEKLMGHYKEEKQIEGKGYAKEIKKLETQITNLESELESEKKKSAELKDCLANGKMPKEEMDAIVNTYNEMQESDKGKYFDREGKLTKKGAAQLIGEVSKKCTGLKIDEKNCQERVDRALKQAEAQKDDRKIDIEFQKGQQR